MDLKDIESFESMCRCAWFHISRGEYDLATPYLIQMKQFEDSHVEQVKQTCFDIFKSVTIERRINREEKHGSDTLQDAETNTH